MSRSGRRKNKQVPPQGTGQLTIEELINRALEDQNTQNLKQTQFFIDYFKHLESARERLSAEIHDVFNKFKKADFEGEYVRIVEGEFGHDPINAVGSLYHPGQRFNIGEISGYDAFPALYVASNQSTAFTEKYHHLETEKVGLLTPEEMAGRKTGSHVTLFVKVKLNAILDLRDEETLRAYLKVISTVVPPMEFQYRAKSLGIFPLQTVQSINRLQKTLYDTQFKNKGLLLDMPANSQAFGKQARDAGIQGIVFPSCRKLDGHNLAIFIENFLNTDSYVQIADKVSFVSKDRQRIDSSNFNFFKVKLADQNELH